MFAKFNSISFECPSQFDEMQRHQIMKRHGFRTDFLFRASFPSEEDKKIALNNLNWLDRLWKNLRPMCEEYRPADALGRLERTSCLSIA
jgi:hypothetical protein